MAIYEERVQPKKQPRKLLIMLLATASSHSCTSSYLCLCLEISDPAQEQSLKRHLYEREVGDLSTLYSTHVTE